MAARQCDFQLVVDESSCVPLVDVLNFEHQRVVAIGRGEVPVRPNEAHVETLTPLSLRGDHEHLPRGRRILPRQRGNEGTGLVTETRLRKWRRRDEVASRKDPKGTM